MNLQIFHDIREIRIDVETSFALVDENDLYNELDSTEMQLQSLKGIKMCLTCKIFYSETLLSLHGSLM